MKKHKTEHELMFEKLSHIEDKIANLEKQTSWSPLVSQPVDGRHLPLVPEDLKKLDQLFNALPQKNLEAIKIYRELTGRGLKESKDAIEGLYRDCLLPPASKSITLDK
jgi:ribosomal protein L7/L12